MTIVIKTKGLKHSAVADMLIWCHRNLQHQRDFAYTRETAIVNGVEYTWPEYFYFNNAEDVTAMKLATGL